MKKVGIILITLITVIVGSMAYVYAEESAEIFLSVDNSTGTPVLSWEVDGQVDILRAEAETMEFQVIGTSDEKIFEDNTAVPGVIYVYKISVTINDNILISNEVSLFTILEAPEPVVSNDAESGKPVLTWEPVDGAYKYEIYRAASEDGEYKKMYRQKSNVYTNKNAIAGTLYYYKVKAICESNSDADSQMSNAVKRRCDLPRPVIKVTSVASTGKNKIQWEAIKDAYKYKVYASETIDGTYSLLKTVSENEHIHKYAVPCQKYYYKVIAVYKTYTSANSAYSNAVMRTCDLARPDVKMDSNKQAKPKLTWAAIENADKYYIYRATSSSGTYKKIYTAKNNRFTNTSAEVGKTYYYKVKAVSEKTSAATSAYSLYDSRYVFNVNKKMVALTFDDGPGPYTKDIVNCLKTNKSYATFFVLGQRVNSYKGALKSAYNNGNEIGNHSYSHPMLTSLSTSGVKSQISRTDNAVKNITGQAPSVMRPPGGDFNSRVKSAVGKPLIYWSIDTLDWKTRSKSATVNSVMNNVRDGSIVLMHDIHKPTKEAALELIPKLKKKGYQLVTISDLAKYRGYTMKNGTVYYSFY